MADADKLSNLNMIRHLQNESEQFSEMTNSYYESNQNQAKANLKNGELSGKQTTYQ